MRSLRNVVALSVVLCCVVPVARAADPEPKAKAAAALAIAQAQRQREHERAEFVRKAPTCYDDADLKVAERFAAEHGKPLVLWVGMRCTECPKVRQDLADAVHCHLKERYGDDSPRVAIVLRDGRDAYVPREKVKADTAAKLRAKWEATPAAKPADPKPVEVSRRAACCETCGANCDCGAGCACDEQAARAVRPPPPVILPTAPPAYPVVTFAPPAGAYQPMPARRPLLDTGVYFRGPLGGGFGAGACVGGT